MPEVKLTIHPEDPDYKPHERTFRDRLTALGRVDELYGTRTISRVEWNRLFHVLYPDDEDIQEKTAEITEPALVEAAA